MPNDKNTNSDLLTAYQVIKLLKERTGLERPTQFGYNYFKKQYIANTNIQGQNLCTREVAIAWCDKFAADQAKKNTEVTA